MGAIVLCADAVAVGNLQVGPLTSVEDWLATAAVTLSAAVQTSFRALNAPWKSSRENPREIFFLLAKRSAASRRSAAAAAAANLMLSLPSGALELIDKWLLSREPARSR